jgi:alkanesulfonate monooxygenase SsuD/methylene tetrahydromethanopterin reductase-like flavin-dependent oxidoreductase (luciferase family)
VIDTVSGGRLVAGFPVGLPYDACLNNGIPPMELRARFDENLELVLRAWREQTPFAWNGTFSQLPHGQHLAAAAAAASPTVWLTGIGKPATMQLTLDRDFGFNYLSWFGLKTTGPRIFDRFLGARRSKRTAAQSVSAGCFGGGGRGRHRRRSRADVPAARRISVQQGPGAVRGEYPRESRVPSGCRVCRR